MENYFSLNSLFRDQLNISLTPVECQVLAAGLKYATNKLNLPPVKKRRDKSLGGNYSNQYAMELLPFACEVYCKCAGLSTVPKELSNYIIHETFKKCIRNEHVRKISFTKIKGK